jgi:hypothetical protein
MYPAGIHRVIAPLGVPKHDAHDRNQRRELSQAGTFTAHERFQFIRLRDSVKRNLKRKTHVFLLAR